MMKIEKLIIMLSEGNMVFAGMQIIPPECNDYHWRTKVNRSTKKRGHFNLKTLNWQRAEGKQY